MPKVEIIFYNDGKVKVEGLGFTGESCQEATKFVDEALGEADNVELKDEFYQKNYGGDVITNGFCG